MIRINFTEPHSSAWNSWRHRSQIAQVALNRTYAAGSNDKVSAKLYREQKQIFLGHDGPFHGKCAYCETLIAANHPGDIDHFRPKGRVTVDSALVTVLDGRRRPIPHPGYYWLAYDYRNLLPACESCNRPSKDRSGGKLVGKWDNFPVKGFRARFPGEERRERALLINPTKRGCKIERHLSFDANGIIKPLSDMGRTCCDVFGLNLRVALVQERKNAYRIGRDAVLSYLVALANDNHEEAGDYLRTINEYESGVRPYSAAGRAGIIAQYSKISSGKYCITVRPKK